MLDFPANGFAGNQKAPCGSSRVWETCPSRARAGSHRRRDDRAVPTRRGRTSRQSIRPPRTWPRGCGGFSTFGPTGGAGPLYYGRGACPRGGRMWCRASGHWYEAVREGGRVVSRYRGCGLAGAARARLEANERLLRDLERQQEAERWRRERERLETLDARLDELLAEMQLWAAAAMRL